MGKIAYLGKIADIRGPRLWLRDDGIHLAHSWGWVSRRVRATSGVCGLRMAPDSFHADCEHLGTFDKLREHEVPTKLAQRETATD